MCGILCYPPRVRHFLTKDATRLLVQTSVLSLLNYCSVVWSGIETNHVNELQKVISFPARVLYRKRKQEHVSPLLQSLNWLRAQDIIGSAVRADFRRLYPAQRQDANVLPKRRQSHQGDKLCDVSTVPLVARWPVFLARGSDADGEPHYVDFGHFCFHVQSGAGSYSRKPVLNVQICSSGQP